jgi:zinc protease
MNMILGGQFTSRINLNLREAKGFTYGATSNFSYTKNAAEFCISTSVSTENTLAAVSEILFELEKIKHGVTKQEFELAQSSITRRFPANFESDGQVLANLAMIAIHNLPLDYFNTYVENILAVSPEQVKDAAVNNIKLDELSIVLVGDKNKLLEEFLVKSAGEVKVINQRGEKIE